MNQEMPAHFSSDSAVRKPATLAIVGLIVTAALGSWYMFDKPAAEFSLPHFCALVAGMVFASWGIVWLTLLCRKNAASAENLFRKLIEPMPVGMLMVDSEGRIVIANPEIEKLFGYTRAELKGQTIENLVPKELQQMHIKHRRMYMTELMPKRIGSGRDLLGRRKDGSLIALDISLNPLQSERGNFVIATVLDMSVPAIVSHRLKTPLTSIRGALGLMEMGKAGELSEKATKMVCIAREEAERLDRLINNLSLTGTEKPGGADG